MIVLFVVIGLLIFRDIMMCIVLVRFFLSKSKVVLGGKLGMYNG